MSMTIYTIESDIMQRLSPNGWLLDKVENSEEGMLKIRYVNEKDSTMKFNVELPKSIALAVSLFQNAKAEQYVWKDKK